MSNPYLPPESDLQLARSALPFPARVICFALILLALAVLGAGIWLGVSSDAARQFPRGISLGILSSGFTLLATGALLATHKSSAWLFGLASLGAIAAQANTGSVSPFGAVFVVLNLVGFGYAISLAKRGAPREA